MAVNTLWQNIGQTLNATGQTLNTTGQTLNTTRQTIQPFNGLNYFSYVSIFSLFIMTLGFLYKVETTIFGILLLYLINIVYSIILSKDIFNSPKANGSSFITILITFVLFSNICSSTVIMKLLRRLHIKYLKQKQTIKLSETNRHKLSLYIIMWISSLFIIFILSAFFFIELPDAPYFSYLFIGKQISAPGMVFGFIIKILGTATLTVLTLYMIYLTVILRKIDKKIVQ